MTDPAAPLGAGTGARSVGRTGAAAGLQPVDSIAAAPVVDAATWEQLRGAARAVAGRAYVPYSGVRVGAAALVDDGRVVVGCNVENASIGLTTCAENGVTSALAASGGGRLVALAVVAGDGRYLAPCGRCRQVLYEFAGPDLLVDAGDAVVTLGELLPGAFGPADVATRRDPPRPEG